ncbi:MAG: hypothetical protein Q9219_000636 [cf. Caloplaca sp. 3 TL-2023]
MNSQTVSTSSTSGKPLPSGHSFAFPKPPAPQLQKQNQVQRRRGPPKAVRRQQQQSCWPIGNHSIPYWLRQKILQHVESPLPVDSKSVTWDKIIDNIFVPGYIARNPQTKSMREAIKAKYVTQQKERYTRLALRVENWRQKVPSYRHEVLRPDLTERGAHDHVQLRFHWQRAQMAEPELEGQSRAFRDLLNIQDFINGKVQGVHKPRLMCWYVLISPRMMNVWYHADQGEEAEIKRAKSVEALDQISNLEVTEDIGVDGRGDLLL